MILYVYKKRGEKDARKFRTSRPVKKRDPQGILYQKKDDRSADRDPSTGEGSVFRAFYRAGEMLVSTIQTGAKWEDNKPTPASVSRSTMSLIVQAALRKMNAPIKHTKVLCMYAPIGIWVRYAAIVNPQAVWDSVIL